MKHNVHDMTLDLFMLIEERKHPLFVVGFSEDEKIGCGMSHGAPGVQAWFAFWQAIGAGVKYAIEQMDAQFMLRHIYNYERYYNALEQIRAIIASDSDLPYKQVHQIDKIVGKALEVCDGG